MAAAFSPDTACINQPSSEQDFNFRQLSLLSSGFSHTPVLTPPEPPTHTRHAESSFQQFPAEDPRDVYNEHVEDPKPSRTISTQTYRETTSLFEDFDGVHFTSLLQKPLSRQSSILQPFEIDPSQRPVGDLSSNGPLGSDQKVFYPAPVPMILNLPPKLSKLPSAAERERRRLTALNGMHSDMRRAAAWLSGVGEGSPASEYPEPQARHSLPPQLRASAFFDQPGVSQRVEIKGASATETLESMLEAAAYAPVTAFADPSYSGQPDNGRRKGPVSRIQEKRRRSKSNFFETNHGPDLRGPRPESSSDFLTMSPGRSTGDRSNNPLNENESALAEGVDAPLRTSKDPSNPPNDPADTSSTERKEMEDDAGDAEGDGQNVDDEDSTSDTPEYDGPPATLLAELQMRKAQMKKRNRTAANVFSNGKNSTLLELDAVLQLQQKSRKNKQLALAWEDHEATNKRLFDDEDVPLGLLVTGGTSMRQPVNQPMGLVQRREMEDSEPLSSRRARLRGEDLRPLGISHLEPPRASSMYAFTSPTLANEMLEEKEEETLAERIRRIRAEKSSAAGVGADFAPEVSNQLGLQIENEVPSTPAYEADESLGQRRKRLQQEALRGSRYPSAQSIPTAQKLKAQDSMADILSHHPVGGSRQVSGGSKGPAPHLTPGYISPQPSLMNPYSLPTGLPTYPQVYPQQIYYPNPAAGYNYSSPTIFNPLLAMQTGGYGPQGYSRNGNFMEPSLDDKQRDLIDRWRQGIAP